MLDWIWEHATPLAALGGLLLGGVLGVVLNLWARIEQFQEARRKREAESPRASIVTDPVREHGWRPVRVVFTNPTRHPLVISEVRVVKPAGMRVCPNATVQARALPKEDQASAALAVDWIVPPAGTDGPGSSGTVFFIAPSSPEQSGNDAQSVERTSKEFAIHFRGREASPRARRITIPAHTVTKH